VCGGSGVGDRLSSPLLIEHFLRGFSVINPFEVVASNPKGKLNVHP